MKLVLIALSLLVLGLQAQENSSAPEASLSSIEKQRASVRKQVRGGSPSHGFFTTPWISLPPSSASTPAEPHFPAASGDCEPLAEATLQGLVTQAAQRENIDTRIVRAMIKRESGGKPCAVSPKGAQGLMQLMPGTQIDLGVQDPFDAESNVSAGVRYLKQMLDRYEGNIALALAAYNAGPQRVSAGGRIPDIPETQAYVTSIMAELNQDDPPAVK